MASTAKIAIKLEVANVGQGVNINPGFNTVTLTVPKETASGYMLIPTATTTAIQLSDIAPQIELTKMYGLWIKAEIGTIFINIDTAGTTTTTSSTAHIVLNVGEECWLPINPDGNAGVTIDGSAVTAAFSFFLLGKV